METMNTITTTTSNQGPDMSHCGAPIEWADRVGLTEAFRAAAEGAFEMLEYDIELCRWSVDDIHAPQFTSWWTNQRAMLRRYLRTAYSGQDVNFVVHRRTDMGDGFVKCYVRIEGGEQS